MEQPKYLKIIEDRYSETSSKDKAAKNNPTIGEDDVWTSDRLIGNKESTKEDAELINVRNKVYDSVDRSTEFEKRGFSPEIFNASDVGMCRRQLFLHKLGVAKPNRRLRGKYLTGSLVHRFLCDEIRDDVVFGDKKDAEFGKSVYFTEDGVTFRGTADMVNYGTGRMVDFKTRATWYGFDTPIMMDVDEATTLVRGLQGVDKSSFAYVNVKTFETRVFPKGVGAGKYMDFNEDRWNHILRKVKDVRDAIEDRLENRGSDDLVVSDFDDVPFTRCNECGVCGDEEEEVKAPDTQYDFSVTKGDVLND